MKTKNIAIVGYGGMGGYHAKLLAESGYFTLTGIYDTDQDRCTHAKSQGIKVYHTYEDIASDSNVDCVLIATPNDVHRYYTEYFAEAKKSVLCEKPAAMDSNEFQSMIDCTTNNGVTLMIHQNRRWDEDFLTAKTVCQSGVIGKVSRIESRVMGANGIPGGWRKLKVHGGGMMPDWGVHLIDQLLTLDNSRIKTLYCAYSYDLGFEVEDGFCLELTFESGLFASVQIDTNCYIPLPRWFIQGKDGTAVIDNWEIDGKIVIPKYDNVEEVKGMKAGNGFTKTMATRTHSSVEVLPLPIERAKNYAFYCHFYEVLCGKTESVINNCEVLRVMKIMEAAAKSAKENKVLKVNL